MFGCRVRILTLCVAAVLRDRVHRLWLPGLQTEYFIRYPLDSNGGLAFHPGSSSIASNLSIMVFEYIAVLFNSLF